MFLYGRTGILQATFRSIKVLRIADQVTQTLQGVGRNTIARRYGFVGIGLGSLDQRLVIVRREIKPSALGVFKLIQQYIRQLAGKVYILASPFILQQFQNCFDQVGVVVKIGIQMGFSILVCRHQAVVLPQVLLNKVQRALCGYRVLRFTQVAGGTRHAFDHEGIPGSQNFFITSRMNAPFPKFKHFVFCPIQCVVYLCLIYFHCFGNLGQ